MSENKLFLELISVDKVLVSQEVDEVYAPGIDGDIGILPDHVTFLTSLRTGEFRYSVNNVVEYVALEGGFLEVFDNKVTVLANGAELGRDINLDEVLRRKAKAEEELNKLRMEDSAAFDAMQAKLYIELTKLNVAGHYK